jgi:fatty acid desaturase
MSTHCAGWLLQWMSHRTALDDDMDDLRNILPCEQLALLQRKSAWRAAWMLVVNWGLIVACFALVIWRPGALSVIAAMLVLGGRQLGLGILMHECAHRSFMPSRALNEWLGNWLCAAPIFADLEVYRGYHMTHHVKTGTHDDPDLPNYAGYPVSRASLARKLCRDLLGVTGARALATLLVLYAHPDPRKLRFGYAHRSQTTQAQAAAHDASDRRLRHLLWNTRRVLIVHGIGLAALWGLGHPLAYALWPAAWMTSYMLYSRIRNAAEHGGLPGTMSTDPWRNTRTVVARWWERLTVAPNHVNFHFEHHLAPTVPSYNLPRLHHWLRRQGILARVPLAHGYVSVVRGLVATSPAK